jgi:hypothetical protein
VTEAAFREEQEIERMEHLSGIFELAGFWKPFRNAFLKHEIYMVFWDCDGRKSVAFQPKGSSIEPKQLTAWTGELQKGFTTLAVAFHRWRTIHIKTKKMIDHAIKLKDEDDKQQKAKGHTVRKDFNSFIDVKVLDDLRKECNLPANTFLPCGSAIALLNLTEKILQLQDIVECESEVMFAGEKHWRIHYQTGKWILPFF